MTALGQVSLNGYTYGIYPPGPDTDANGWMPIGGAWVKVDVTDTAAFLDINNATAAQLELMTVFGQNTAVGGRHYRLANAGDDSNFGRHAKSDYYQGLTPAYNCKDAPFDTVEELLLVKGITPSMLYGTPEGNVIDAKDAQADAQQAGSSTMVGGGSSSGTAGGGAAASRQATGGTAGTGAAGGAGGTAATTTGDTDWEDIYSQSTMPLAEMLTTMSMERNIAADGTPRVNINTATVTDLTGIGLSTNLANALIRYRTPANGQGGIGGGAGVGPRGGPGAPRGGPGGGAGGPAGGPGGPGGAPGGGGRPGNGGAPGVRPGRQAAGAGIGTRPGGAGGAGGTNTGTGGGTTGGRPGAGGGTGGTSGATFKTIADLLTIPGFSQTVMQQIADYVSVDSNQFHPNLININTAPQEVLALVPGMDHTTLNAIMQYRQSGQAFQSLGDFFTLEGVSRQEFQNVMASLCAKSSIYRIRIKVRTPGQPNVYAATAYVEMTDNGPQLLQWRETPAVPGWAYWVPSPTLIAPTTTECTINGTTSGSVGQ